MERETKQREIIVGDMLKRREKMADERRYIIYYTFGKEAPSGKSSNSPLEAGNQKPNEVSENV